MDKVLILMRGMSGSGKSHRARELCEGGVILSTDDLFMAPTRYGQEYLWGVMALGTAHKLNQHKAMFAMAKAISPVIIDNTNCSEWERKPYLEMAHQYGYKVRIEESTAPWKNDFQACYEKNTHDVPLDVIKGQWEKMQKDRAYENTGAS